MLCSFLGIPIALEKTVSPSTTLAFAGIEQDTVLMEVRFATGKAGQLSGSSLSFST